MADLYHFITKFLSDSGVQTASLIGWILLVLAITAANLIVKDLKSSYDGVGKRKISYFLLVIMFSFYLITMLASINVFNEFLNNQGKMGILIFLVVPVVITICRFSTEEDLKFAKWVVITVVVITALVMRDNVWEGFRAASHYIFPYLIWLCEIFTISLVLLAIVSTLTWLLRKSLNWRLIITYVGGGLIVVSMVTAFNYVYN